MPKYEFSCQVEPQYLAEQSDPAAGVYLFAYTITITNTGQVAAQLVARHWTLGGMGGHVEEDKGLVGVGPQTQLRPRGSFQYTSGAPLRTATGTMRGSYFCVAEDGTRFEAEIPLFVLDSGAGTPGRVLH